MDEWLLYANALKCLHFHNAFKSVTEANKKCMLMIQDIVQL